MAIVQMKMDDVTFGCSYVTFSGPRPRMHATAGLQSVTEMSIFLPLCGFLDQGQQTLSKMTDSKYLKLCRLIDLCHHYSTLLL